MTINERLDALAKHVNEMVDARDRGNLAEIPDAFMFASQALGDLNLELCRREVDTADAHRMSVVHPSWVKPRLLPPGTPDPRD